MPMTISIFDTTEDAYWWILCTEKYFKAMAISEAEKMAATAKSMRGPALQWWNWWSPRHPQVTWDSFTTDFLWRFKAEWRQILPALDEEEEPDSEALNSAMALSLSNDSFADPVLDIVDEQSNSVLSTPNTASLSDDSVEQLAMTEKFLEHLPPPAPPDHQRLTTGHLSPPSLSHTSSDQPLSPSDLHLACVMQSRPSKDFAICVSPLQGISVGHVLFSGLQISPHTWLSPSIAQDSGNKLSPTVQFYPPFNLQHLDETQSQSFNKITVRVNCLKPTTARHVSSSVGCISFSPQPGAPVAIPGNNSFPPFADSMIRVKLLEATIIRHFLPCDSCIPSKRPTTNAYLMGIRCQSLTNAEILLSRINGPTKMHAFSNAPFQQYRQWLSAALKELNVSISTEIDLTTTIEEVFPVVFLWQTFFLHYAGKSQPTIRERDFSPWLIEVSFFKLLDGVWFSSNSFFTGEHLLWLLSRLGELPPPPPKPPYKIFQPAASTTQVIWDPPMPLPPPAPPDQKSRTASVTLQPTLILLHRAVAGTSLAKRTFYNKLAAQSLSQFKSCPVTGIGENVRPSVMTPGKALFGGIIPISALTADKDVTFCFKLGIHGKNPLGDGCYYSRVSSQNITQMAVAWARQNEWLLLSSVAVRTLGCFHEKHLAEVLEYFHFGLWWVALGVASSIGLKSGLHTIVLFLGLQVALFTIKATQCDPIDSKIAPYDTLHLKTSPSWLDKECSQFRPLVFLSIYSSWVPLSSILHQVQMEVALWGMGTAHMSGSSIDSMEELISEAKGTLNQIKCWFLSHILNIITRVLDGVAVDQSSFNVATIYLRYFKSGPQHKTLRKAEGIIHDFKTELMQQHHMLFSSVSMGKWQQWDPGGLYDMSTAAKPSQFKQWDPGKFVQGGNFYNLEDKVDFDGVGNVMMLEVKRMMTQLILEDDDSAYSRMVFYAFCDFV